MSKRNAAVTDPNGGFVTTQGAPRYSLLAGRHLVVGRGRSEELPTIAAAYARRDELLKAEAEGRKAKRAQVLAQPPAPAVPGVEPGARVEFALPSGERLVGTVTELGPRSIAIQHGRDTYRRAATDVTVLPHE